LLYNFFILEYIFVMLESTFTLYICFENTSGFISIEN